VVARGGLPGAALEALAVHEEAVHVADDGGGAAGDHRAKASRRAIVIES
jgi:hypothetical protein